MAEDPEQVLPEKHVAATLEYEEVGAEEPVKAQLDQADCDDRHGQSQEEGRDEGHPREDRHPHEGHARGAEVNNGHDEVECAEQ